MLEEQIEYFRGNRQEIENEKQRKRELILHFDFDRNLAKEENKPFNHSAQFQGMDTLSRSKPRATTTMPRKFARTFGAL